MSNTLKFYGSADMLLKCDLPVPLHAEIQEVVVISNIGSGSSADFYGNLAHYFV